MAASHLDPVADRLRAELGLGEPFNDPGVEAFGLHNAVFAIGDAFLEVVAPIRPDTAAGRYLERHGGDCGYMVIFQLDDLAGARARVHDMGIRVVWQADLPDISGTHLHPADMRGAIVSLDRPDPPESWRWGGPAWTGRSGVGAPGRLAGVTIAVTEPKTVAEGWAEVLGADVSDHEVHLDGGSVGFVGCDSLPDEGLREIALELPDDVRRGRDQIEIGGARFTLLES